MSLVLLVLALTLVVVLWRVRRRRRARHTSAVLSGPPGGVPTFRIVTLGLQGSGKTLLLTGIYRRLQTPGDRGFYLRVPHEQLIELNRWYRKAADVDEEWPRGTTRGELREFEFSVMADVGGATEPVVKLGYLEYPGELLTDPDAPGSTAQATLLQAIAGADALVGIIDGFRLLQAEQGDQRGTLMLEASLDAMINAMLPVRSPIVFVITKWDLLDHLHPDENERLRIVRDRLLATPGFADLVHVHSTRRIVRLIPVTAVGHDFAVYSGGTVRKKPGGRFTPANVEAPLSVVVPDILRQTELALDRATRAELLAAAQRRMRMGPAEALRTLGSHFTAHAARALASAVGAGVIAESGLMLLLDTLHPHDDPAEHGARMARLGEADRLAEDYVQARRRVVGELQRQVAVLEAKLPVSRLGGDHRGTW
ncbi:hypothetical protein [Amycolatopsis sp. Hca4]|uniref:hypothetical protein n=1 Tax=unclassified Amycolatopsis TaxID=2618356 RepID=UPI001591E191|nr:hypothetical protein [Amycolatopsis sp. Hca4]QKV72688.1 hypothetical protein HUT10_01635 [Amycolatopsis sp. Hca4]